MRVLNEFVEKKEVKKTRPRLKQADQVRECLQFVDFEPNQYTWKVLSNFSPLKQLSYIKF